MNLVFLSAANAIKLVGSVRLVDSLHVYVMFITNYQTAYGELILNYFFGNNCPEFRNGRLDCYF